MNVTQALDALNAAEQGLSTQEAQRRAETAGPNVIASVERDSAILRYLAQFKDWLVLLLLASAAITGYLGDWSTAGVLIALVLLNTVIGYSQEQRAVHTMRSLEQLVKPTTEVFRDGHLVDLDSALLVPGDVIRLGEGESIPADVRIIRAQALSTNEFALTGESEPTRKHTQAIRHEVPLGDRFNAAFAGTTVATGEGLGLVTATGMHTELGRIARLSERARPAPSPLQLEMAHIAKVVGGVVVVLAAIVMALGVLADLPFREALLFAVGMACALVPQGLPAEVNTALAQASGTLARHRALVKRLSSVETLGATHVICTDKTGTLTKNEMTVQRIMAGQRPVQVTGSGYAPEGELLHADGTRAQLTPWQLKMLECGVLASNAELVPADDEHPDWWVRGDPTEGALLTVAAKAGIDLDRLQHDLVEVRELPFDSVRKRMTSLRRDADGRHTAWVKGSPESVLAGANRILDGDTVRPLSDADRSEFMSEDHGAAQQALRNLALAVREIDERTATDSHAGPDAVERDLILLGFASMIDPLREEVPAAMAQTHEAHVRVNIVTGDSALTAGAIARLAGIGAGPDELQVVSADDLHDMSDDEVQRRALAGGVVFSRVAPEDKMRIVELIKGSGAVVAVTGDGINDAPALRAASIGVAMGRSGTDVAKQAADVVLLDDSFATLVRAVREGRSIYANIRKGVLSCLSSNMAEFVVNGVSLVLTATMGVPLALNVLQILAIDLLGEIIPIAALGSDPEEGETMRRRPRDPKARILNGRSMGDIAVTGAVMGALGVAAYLLTYRLAGVDPAGLSSTDPITATAMTVTYVTILVTQLVNIVHRRSVHGLFTRYQFSNRWFWWAIVAALAIMLIIVYVPFVAEFFGTAPLGGREWALVGTAAVLMLGARTLIARAFAPRG